MTALITVTVTGWREEPGGERMYEIVTSETFGKSFHVFRRYSEFMILRERIGKEAPELPTKGGWFNLGFLNNFSSDFLEERRRGLESFLTISLASKCAVLCNFFWHFLGVDEETPIVLKWLFDSVESYSVDLEAAVELSQRAGEIYRFRHSIVVARLLEICNGKNSACIHGALMIFRSILSQDIFPELIVNGEGIAVLLSVVVGGSSLLLREAAKGVLFSLVQKYPSVLFDFFHRDGGLRWLAAISLHAEGAGFLVAAVLFLGAVGSRDVAIALSEKNSDGPALLSQLLGMEKIPASRLISAAVLGLLLRLGLFSSSAPHLIKRIDGILLEEGTPLVFKFPGFSNVLSLLFRTESSIRLILEECVGPLDGVSIFFCRVIRLRAQEGEGLPIRREFGEKLLKLIHRNQSLIHVQIYAETFVSIRGFPETLLEPFNRRELLKICQISLSDRFAILKNRLQTTQAKLTSMTDEVELRSKNDLFQTWKFKVNSESTHPTNQLISSLDQLSDARDNLKEKWMTLKNKIPCVSANLDRLVLESAVLQIDPKGDSESENFERLFSVEDSMRKLIDEAEDMRTEDEISRSFIVLNKLLQKEQEARKLVSCNIQSLRHSLCELETEFA